MGKKTYISLLAGVILLFAFQNCGKSFSSRSETNVEAENSEGDFVPGRRPYALKCIEDGYKSTDIINKCGVPIASLCSNESGVTCLASKYYKGECSFKPVDPNALGGVPPVYDFCEHRGHKVEGEYCVDNSGKRCELWQYLRGECSLELGC